MSCERLFYQFSEEILESQERKRIVKVLVYSDDRFAIVFEKGVIEYWEMARTVKLISKISVDFETLGIWSFSLGKALMVSIGLEVILLDLTSGKIESVINLKNEPFERNFDKGFDGEDLQFAFIEKTCCLAGLMRRRFGEEGIDHSFLIVDIKEKKVKVRKEYPSKEMKFTRVFKIGEEGIGLMDLQHDYEKNPRIILWINENGYEEKEVVAQRWFTGTLCHIELSFDGKSLRVFGNVNGHKNPYIFDISISSGEMIISRYGLESEESWLYFSPVSTNPSTKVMACLGIDFQFTGHFLRVETPEEHFILPSSVSESWGASDCGDSIIGLQRINDSQILLRNLRFFSRKIGIAAILARKGIISKYGEFITREILDFLN